MQPATKINIPYLKSEIESVIKKNSAIEFNNKVQQLTTRILTELSLEDIVLLEKVVRAEKPCWGQSSQVAALSHATINSLVTQIKSIKLELNKLEKVGELLKAGNLDGAASLLNEMSPEYASNTQEVRETIAQKYREKGDNDKADRLLKGLSPETIVESPAERAVAETGKDLTHSGLNTLRQVFPDTRSTLPTDNQMDKALDGLHEMSIISTGRKRDPSLENESIESLQKKLATAEEQLNKERENYTQALTTHNPDIFMPALQRKQKVMQDILKLKLALDGKGVSQKEEGDPAEQINEAFRQGITTLKETIESRGLPDNSGDPDCKVS